MSVPWLREQDSNLRLQIMSLIRGLSSIPHYISDYNAITYGRSNDYKLSDFYLL